MGRELTCEPDDWRGGQPPGTLRMQLVGPPLDGDQEGWVTVTGWRHHDDEPGPEWVRVQVRVDALPEGAR